MNDVTRLTLAEARDALKTGKLSSVELTKAHLAAMEKARAALPKVTFCANPYEVAEGCDALLLMTEWDEFRGLDLTLIRGTMVHPFILDARNLFDPAAMASAGIRYKSIGR